MSSVEQVKARVAATVAQTEQAVHGMRAVGDQLDEALARLRLTAMGTVHPTLVEAIGRLEQAKARLDEATTLARGAADSASSYRTIA